MSLAIVHMQVREGIHAPVQRLKTEAGMSRTYRTVATLTALLLVGVILPGCSSQGTASPPESTGAVPGSGGVLDGASLVETKCTTCHTRERIDAASKDLTGWQTTINRMITSHGAQITTEEQSAIAIYLAGK
jgi:hypothetical protein